MSGRFCCEPGPSSSATVCEIKLNALVGSMREQACQQEYHSCSGGLTHNHSSGRPASRDLAVARQGAGLTITERVCVMF
jgi:hypothetical protein